jgi:hypothetical protein
MLDEFIQSKHPTFIFFQREPLKLCMQHHPVQEICKASGRIECEKFPTPSMLPHNKNYTILSQVLEHKGAQNENRNLLLHSSPPSQLLIPAGIPIFRIER